MGSHVVKTCAVHLSRVSELGIAPGGATIVTSGVISGVMGLNGRDIPRELRRSLRVRPWCLSAQMRGGSCKCKEPEGD